MTIKWDTLKSSETLERERLDNLSNQIRSERDKRIAATDYYMLQDAPAAPVGVHEYRKALRDITLQEGFPENVIWPVLTLSDIPSKVTRRQAIAALTLAGFIPAIESALSAIEDPTRKTVAEIFWKESLHFERYNPFLNELAASVGMSQNDLDNLFRQAVSI